MLYLVCVWEKQKPETQSSHVHPKKTGIQDILGRPHFVLYFKILLRSAKENDINKLKLY